MPHCDSMDGPMVLATRRALDAHDPTLVLPYLKEEGGSEVIAAFERTIAAHDGDPPDNQLADLRAGLIDELDLEVVPSLIGGDVTPTLFGGRPLGPGEWPSAIVIDEARLEHGRLLVRATVRRGIAP